MCLQELHVIKGCPGGRHCAQELPQTVDWTCFLQFSQISVGRMLGFDWREGGRELETVDLQSSELKGRGRPSILHYQRGWQFLYCISAQPCFLFRHIAVFDSELCDMRIDVGIWPQSRLWSMYPESEVQERQGIQKCPRNVLTCEHFTGGDSYINL